MSERNRPVPLPAFEPCDRENEILEALTRSGSSLPEELTMHTSNCGGCADLVLVAGAILSDHRTTRAELAVPPSGIMFWRMQHRARLDAERVTGRAVTLLQSASILGGVLAAMATVGLLSLSGAKWRAGWNAVRWNAADLLRTSPATTPVVVVVLSAIVALSIGWLVAADDGRGRERRSRGILTRR